MPFPRLSRPRITRGISILRAAQLSPKHVEDACQDSSVALKRWRFLQPAMRTAASSPKSRVYKQVVAGVKRLESPTAALRLELRWLITTKQLLPRALSGENQMTFIQTSMISLIQEFSCSTRVFW